MAQLGDPRAHVCTFRERSAGESDRARGLKHLVAFAAVGAALVTSGGASAQTARTGQTAQTAQTAAPAAPAVAAAPVPPNPASPATPGATAAAEPAAMPAVPAMPAPGGAPAPSPVTPDPDAVPLTQDQRDRASCERSFAVVLPALEHDVKYARNWTDAWYVVGGSLAALNLSQIFMVDDYRKGEAIVNGSLSLLLMIQRPTAVWSADAVRGLRSAAADNPCQALTTARYIFESNEADYKDHTGIVNHVVGIALNLAAGAIVALADKHWEFFGHGDEGFSTLVGIAAGELQLFTYPRPSMKPGSLQLSAGASPLQLTF